MSFYDDASLVFLPSGGAGKDGKAYSIKPVPEYGTNLVTNGGFDTDTWWEKGTGWSISNGYASVSNGAFARLATPPSPSQILVVGKQYKCTFEVVESEGGELYVESNINVAVLTGVTALGIHSVTFTAQDDQIRFQARNNSLISIDNVSVREVIEGDGDFTFSRGSNLTATRVDSNGLIEKGRENLLLQSNQFDTTWTTSNSSVTSGQSGYDGSSDAWLLDISGGTSSQRIEQSMSFGGIQTFSVYAKAGTLNWIRMRGSSNTYFDLANGVIGTDGHIDSKIESIGNGWYRCSVVTETSTLARIYLATDNGNVTQSSGNIYIQDAQLELGLAATEYIESGATTGKAGILEDSPRFDYSGGASCPSLLLEPSRTNLIKQTEYFGDSQWLVDGVSLDANNITSPEGLQNAYKITDDTTTGYHLITDSDVFLADGVMRTWSVFVKKGTARYCVIGAGNQFVVQDNALIFDMEGGTYTSTGTSSFFNTIHDPVNMGNGWYRIGFSSDLNSSSYNKLSIGVSQGATWSGNVSYTGDGSLNYYIFGAQVEQGSYPTSYIPNHSGGSVTRNADSCSGAGTSSTFNDSEGVLYAEIAALTDDQSSRTITLTDGTFDERIQLSYYTGGSNQIRVFIKSGGTFSAVITTTLTDITEFNKIAYRYKSGETKLFINGSLIGTSADTFSITGLNVLQFANGDGLSNPLQGKAKQVIVFNTALSNTDLEILTGTSYESFAAMATALNYTTYE